jgi:hypothetical protein
MTSQLSLFDALRAPAIIRQVVADGHVLQGEPQIKFVMPHPRSASPAARIELHPARDGLWMWSASYNTGNGASGYKVGEKWGQFALSAEEALHYAIEELKYRLARAYLSNESDRKTAAKILAWTESLGLEPVNAQT